MTTIVPEELGVSFFRIEELAKLGEVVHDT
jgi:hypothetical protein